METYTADAFCRNCGAKDVKIKIPKAELIANFKIDNIKCPECGNYSLEFYVQ